MDDQVVIWDQEPRIVSIAPGNTHSRFVCVWAIWKDVKLPLFRWWLFFVVFAFELYLQGVAADHLGPLPTKTPIWSGDTDWDANLRTCTNFHFSSMATGQAKNRHVDLFSTSFLHCCRQSAYSTNFMIKKTASEPSSEQGRRKFTSYWNSRWINKFSWQFLRDCFVHVRCIPQQNSHCCFWASVSFLLFTSSWQEPFGESLSRLTIDSKTMSEFTLLN